MKKTTPLFWLFLFPAVIILASCEKNRKDDTPSDPVKINLSVEQKSVVDSANDFAFNMFKPIIAEAKSTENVLISPFSISSALTMTLNGAANETYNAMLKTLCLDDMTLQEINETYLKLMTDMIPVDDKVTVEIANSVWVENRLSVKEAFINALATYFKAEAKNFDISDPTTVDKVNNWIEDKTHDKIKDMLQSLDDNTVMLLINAIYFNGKWRYEFDKDDTSNKPFYLSSGETKNVPTMYNETNLKVFKGDDATIVDLPYGQGNYTMVVVLPDEGYTPARVAAELNATKWQEWMSALDNQTIKVHLSLPKFEYKYKRDLNDDLSGMGMSIAFDRQKADFSNIADVDPNNLYINKVLHQAYIKTNEEGTEAAAATVVEIGVTSAIPSDFMIININRPFLYFIREVSTGTILFAGKVEDPALN